MGFTKLDERILQSSIMAEDPKTFKVWIALLAACRENGIAYVSPVYLSAICHMNEATIQRAIERLESPDDKSRGLEDDGRRIRRTEGGYAVTNYLAYREISIQDAEAERKRLYRARKESGPGQSGTVQGPSASASASASTFISFKEGVWGGIQESDIEAWSKAYPACDVQVELKKMVEWLKANPTKTKSNYRKFIVNWLSRTQDRGGSGDGRGRRDPDDPQVGASAKPDKSPEYWARARELKAQGLEGEALTDALNETRKTT